MQQIFLTVFFKILYYHQHRFPNKYSLPSYLDGTNVKFIINFQYKLANIAMTMTSFSVNLHTRWYKSHSKMTYFCTYFHNMCGCFEISF